MKQTCRNCKYCKEKENGLLIEMDFYCYRYPIRELVDKNHWCGEWKKKIN